MDNLKLGIYEIFSYLIPGGIFISAIWSILSSCDSLIFHCAIKEIGALNGSVLILLIVVSFFVGFCNQHISFKIFAFLPPLIWSKRLKGKEMKLHKYNDQFSLIREKSPENYKLAEKWMAFRGMCYNSFYSLIFIFLIQVVEGFRIGLWTNKIHLLSILIILYFMFMSLRRGVSFHEWSIATIESSYNLLQKDLRTTK